MAKDDIVGSIELTEDEAITLRGAARIHLRNVLEEKGTHTTVKARLKMSLQQSIGKLDVLCAKWDAQRERRRDFLYLESRDWCCDPGNEPRPREACNCSCCQEARAAGS